MLRQDYVASLVSPYISNNGKPRLIEPPDVELKRIQRRIKDYLCQIDVPSNIFSGVKKRSYVGNAKLHAGSNLRYLYKIDLTAFFPSITRNTVYSFFKNDLCCSSDIAEILTNFTTIDLAKSNCRHLEEVDTFLKTKRVKCRNHLISGAPTSQILSYLVNHQMFEELQSISDRSGILMSVYVDDITFSSEQIIVRDFKRNVISVIQKHCYRISKNKVKSYSKTRPKLVTGVIIDATGRMTIRDSLRYKVISEFRLLRENPQDVDTQARLKGLLTAVKQIDNTVFPSIRKYLCDLKAPPTSS